MRIIATIAACAAVSLAALPLGVQAQTSTTTTTIKSDANSIWEKIKGSWNQTKGAVKEQWGKLTDDEFDRIAGKRDQLVGRIQESYGIGKDEAERQVSDWEATQRDMD